MAKEEIKQNKVLDQEKDSKSEKMEVDVKTLKELIESNKKLQESNARLEGMVDQLNANAVATSQQGATMMRRNKDYFLDMRRWEGKYFLGYENVGTDKKPLYIYNEYNPQTRESVQYCNIILDGVEKPIKVEYVRFVRESEIIKVKQLSKSEHEEVIVQGMVQKKDFAENGYGMFETMVTVPMEVVYKKYTYKVLLEDGRELEIDEKCLANA